MAVNWLKFWNFIKLQKLFKNYYIFSYGEVKIIRNKYIFDIIGCDDNNKCPN